MSLPCRLYPGYASIYGAQSITGIVPKQGGLQFGTIDQIYDNVPGTVSIGQSVLFKYEDCVMVDYQGTQYFLLPEQKIILIENILS